MDENASWRQILTHRYGDMSSFLINDTTIVGKKDSLWRRDLLFVGEDVIVNGWFNICVRKGLGAGEAMIFWKHHWLGNQPLYLDFPTLFVGCQDQNVTVVVASH